jgi:hypothetical protein
VKGKVHDLGFDAGRKKLESFHYKQKENTNEENFVTVVDLHDGGIYR